MEQAAARPAQSTVGLPVSAARYLPGSTGGGGGLEGGGDATGGGELAPTIRDELAWLASDRPTSPEVLNRRHGAADELGQ